MDYNSLLTLIFALIILIVVIIVNTKKVGAKYNRSYIGEISIKELKAFYFKKHYCTNCNHKLIRNYENEFMKEGWDKMNGTYFYGKKYRVITTLKCPNCLRKYHLTDLANE